VIINNVEIVGIYKYYIDRKGLPKIQTREIFSYYGMSKSSYIVYTIRGNDNRTVMLINIKKLFSKSE